MNSETGYAGGSDPYGTQCRFPILSEPWLHTEPEHGYYVFAPLFVFSLFIKSSRVLQLDPALTSPSLPQLHCN